MKKLQESHLYQEIHQQPDVLARLLQEQDRPIADLANAIRQNDIQHILIAARGTSDNAGRYAQYLLGIKNKILVSLATPSLFSIYQSPPNLRHTLVLGISQSGKSPDIVGVLAEAKRQGALTAAFSNKVDSDLAKQGDFVVDLSAGEEQAVAATKTYSAELATVALLSAHLAQDSQMHAELAQIPDSVRQCLQMNQLLAEITPRYRYMARCVVIGRGLNYATAFEISLKLKELTYTVVEPYSNADFQHGPLALIDQGFPVIVIAPQGLMQEDMRAFIPVVQKHGAEVIVISDLPNLLEMARTPLPLPCSVPEWLSPLTTIIPGQLLAMHLAHARDYDVDAPRSIRKVTETK